MSGRREKRTNKKDKNVAPTKAEVETVGDVEAEVEYEIEAEVDEESPSSTNDGKKTRKIKESVIDHTYRDYSLVEVEDEEEVRPTVARAAAGVDLSKNSNFPAKLHAILSNPGYQHIICWMVSSIHFISLTRFMFHLSSPQSIKFYLPSNTSPMEGVGILL